MLTRIALWFSRQVSAIWLIKSATVWIILLTIYGVAIALNVPYEIEVLANVLWLTSTFVLSASFIAWLVRVVKAKERKRK